jgi:hypothetical protein
MTAPSKVKFIDEELEKAFNGLADNDPIKKALIRAIQNIREDFQAGEYIPKNKIPEAYLEKYGINNVRVYDLPFAWRLMYTISGSSEIGIISVLLDWMDHKNYEKLFGI